jgi:hypothetical protein
MFIKKLMRMTVEKSGKNYLMIRLGFGMSG